MGWLLRTDNLEDPHLRAVFMEKTLNPPYYLNHKLGNLWYSAIVDRNN